MSTRVAKHIHYGCDVAVFVRLNMTGDRRTPCESELVLLVLFGKSASRLTDKERLALAQCATSPRSFCRRRRVASGPGAPC